MRRRSSVKGVDTTQEAQGCQTSSRIARRRSSVKGVNTAQESVLTTESVGSACFN